MCKILKMGKKVAALLSLSVFLGLSGAVTDDGSAVPVMAETLEQPDTVMGEAEVPEASETVTDETDAATVGDEAATDAGTTEGTETATQETTDPEDWGFNAKEKFVIFVCCLFSVVFCLVVALWGNPNDRLKDKYKRARKQQQLQEKKLREKAEREAKRAAAEAKYQEELAQYEADRKAYEEEKAAKAAVKAAKKAEREARK